MNVDQIMTNLRLARVLEDAINSAMTDPALEAEVTDAANPFLNGKISRRGLPLTATALYVLEGLETAT
jgi:hypothetical protein